MIVVVDPRHMRYRVTVLGLCVCVCVCLSVCLFYHASSYIPGLYVQSEAIYSFLWAFTDMYCVDFAENV